jgi:GntR family transcriptional regulator/MocR family aminotransferase
MSQWTPTIALDESSTRPLAARIADSIARDIRRGRLAPGALLPGSRTLAATLGVHRNTVLAAYEALRAEGWIESESARSTRVAASLPERPRPSRGAAARAQIPERTHFALGPGPDIVERSVARGVIALYGGMPELGIFPVEAFARAHRRALRTKRSQLLDYATPYGHPALRTALAEMTSSLRGLAAKPENILVTRGSQQALDLVARALFDEGGVIAVESMGYAPAWAAFRAAGARIVALPVDREGLDVAALEALCEREAVRAVYVTPHHQYPTTVTLSATRRLALLALAKQRRLCVIEDDYDHEFHYEGRPVLPLASADSDGSVVYIATLSKLLAPGLRTGFVVAPRALIDHLAARRTYVDRQGDLTVEAALAELIEDGVVARHARRARKTYLERRDVFAQALAEHAGDALRFDVTRGGMALWARVEGEKGSEPLIARALDEGVFVQRTRSMCFDGRDRPFVRLGFAGSTPAVLREAARRLGRAARRG